MTPPGRTPTTRGHRLLVSAAAVATTSLVGLAATSAVDDPVPVASDGCISAEAYYEAPSEPTQYVLGPDHCLAETGWEAGIHVEEELEVPAAGASVGARLTVRRPPV